MHILSMWFWSWQEMSGLGWTHSHGLSSCHPFFGSKIWLPKCILTKRWRPKGTWKPTVWQQRFASLLFCQFPCQSLLYSHFYIWGVTKWINTSKLDDNENKCIPLLEPFPCWWLQGRFCCFLLWKGWHPVTASHSWECTCQPEPLSWDWQLFWVSARDPAIHKLYSWR